MPNKPVTITDFRCKKCKYRAGMRLTLVPEDKKKEDVCCPKCGSGDITYETML